jgi:methionyl-tRNA formyltransferase
MWLSEEVDAGQIIDQVTFEITPFDTCATVYEKVAQANRTMILGLLGALRGGRRPGTEQGKTDEPLLPRRKPSDGLVNWEETAKEVYDFVRALTRPYPGAFSFMDGRRWRIWSAALLPGDDPGGRAGEVVGPLLSPEDGACGLIVACGRGAIALLEIETDDDERLSGGALAQLQWTGRRWAENGPSAGNRSASGR